MALSALSCPERSRTKTDRPTRRGPIRSPAPRPTRGKTRLRRMTHDLRVGPGWSSGSAQSVGRTGSPLRLRRNTAAAARNACGVFFGTDAARWPHRAVDLMGLRRAVHPAASACGRTVGSSVRAVVRRGASRRPPPRTGAHIGFEGCENGSTNGSLYERHPFRGSETTVCPGSQRARETALRERWNQEVHESVGSELIATRH
jgi:hypothetical protein